jgi:cell shape-determining protein MreD
MFTWLTNTGAAGLVLLMGLTAFAVIGYFRRNTHGLSLWVRVIAPAVSGVLLIAMFVMILGNFQLMLGQAEPDATTFVLPGLIIAALAIGIVWALVLRSTKPAIYRQIGHGTEPGAYGTEMIDVVDSQ